MNQSDKENSEIENILKEYLVPFPNENEIDKTVECVQNYLPVSQKSLYRKKVKRILSNTVIGFATMQKSFFALSILLYAVGCLIAVHSYYAFYEILFVVAPIPIITSLLNVFRGREENVCEIELTCKITPQEIAVSKIFIACIFNTVLNIILSVFIYDKAQNLMFWKITMLWLVPMVLSGAAAISLCARFKSNYAVSGTLAVWVASALFLSQKFRELEIMQNMHLLSCVLLLIIGIAIFAFTLKKISKSYYFERGTNYETDSGKPFKAI